MPDPRRPRSWGVVFATLAGTFAVAGLAAWGIHTRFLRYVPVAARHLPPTFDHGVRVHVEQKFIFEPVRAELLPLLDALGQGPSPLPDGRLERLRQRHGVEVTLDLREVLVGWSAAERALEGAAAGAVARPGAWVVVLGGKFGPGKVIPALDAALRAEGHPSSRQGDTVRVADFTVAQAPDGAVIAGSTPEVVTAAVAGSARGAELGLAGIEALAAGAGVPGTAPGAFRATGTRLGPSLQVEVAFGVGPDDDPASAASRWQGLLAAWTTGAGLGWGNRVEVAPRPGVAAVRVTLTEPDLRAFFHLLAGRVRAGAGLPVSAAGAASAPR